MEIQSFAPNSTGGMPSLGSSAAGGSNNTVGGGSDPITAAINAVSNLGGKVLDFFSQKQVGKNLYQEWLNSSTPELQWFFHPSYVKKEGSGGINVVVILAVLFVVVLVAIVVLKISKKN